MEVFNSFLNLIGTIVIATGISFIYNARVLSKKYFPSDSVNEMTRKFKFIGFIISVIGGIVFLV